MPTIRNYKEGSVIYFENDKGDEIYILKSGKILLTSTQIDTGEEIKEVIQEGEFFGVKSVLGHYRREETAQVIAPSVVIVLSLEEFENMMSKNFALVMKMLKVFSNQLRRIGKKVKELMMKGEDRMPATELFYIGEYYLKNHKNKQAIYAYKKYIECYPNGQFVASAMERIKIAETGGMIPSTTGLRPETIESPSTHETIEKKEDETKPVSEGIDIAKKYYEALSLFSQEKYNEAIEIHKTIIAQKQFKDEATAKFVEKSYFELGRCQMKLEQYQDAIDTYTNMIKRYPRTESMKEALFNIGNCYELLQNYQKAINFYQKVVSMPPKESINAKAKKLLEDLQNKL